jgi:VWFA-related protein
MRALCCAVLSLSALLCSDLRSQEVPSQSPAETPIYRLFTSLVVIDGLVQSRDPKETFSPLNKTDFMVSEDGAPQSITYFSHDQLPLSVVFLFDLTDTVRPALKPLALGAREVLNHLKPQDETAVMVFSSHTELLQPFTTDRALAVSAIEKASGMKSEDGTFIYESMYEAVDEALKSPAPESRRVLVWLTDGSANSENSFSQKTIGKGAPAVLHSKEEANAKLLHSGVVVSALIERTAATDMVQFNPLSRAFGARFGDIRKYADETGGPVLNTSKEEVAVQLARLIDQLRELYTLGYKPSTTKPPGTFCRIQVTLSPNIYVENPALRKGGLIVRTRTGYYR